MNLVIDRQRHIRQQGFTLLELLLVITLVAVLILVAIENLLPLTGEAERVAVQQNRVAVDTALRGEAAERLLKQGREAVQAMEGSNPVDWLGRPPANYLGEQPGVDPADISPGHWYWDSHGGWLVYRVRHARYFETDLEGPARIRFRVTREGSEQFFGLRLESPDHYQWSTEGSELARLLLGSAASERRVAE